MPAGVSTTTLAGNAPASSASAAAREAPAAQVPVVYPQRICLVPTFM